MERDYQIDILKAIGIILVVAGHSGNPFTVYIYTFHLPLFFFVTGFLRYNARSTSYGEFFKKKVKNILIPYVLFWFFSVVIYDNLFSLILVGHLQPFGIDKIKGLLLGGSYLAQYSNNFPLWFLQLFFIAVIVFEPIIRHCNSIIKVLVCLILAGITIPFQELLPGRPMFHINVLPAALVFMFLGYGTKYLIESDILKRLEPGRLGGIAVLLMVAGFKMSMLNAGNISQINTLWYFSGAYCSILGLYIFLKLLVSAKTLQYIGRESLFIMALHSPLIWYGDTVSRFIAHNIGFSNAFVINIIAVAVIVGLCLGVKEVWSATIKCVYCRSVKGCI